MNEQKMANILLNHPFSEAARRMMRPEFEEIIGKRMAARIAKPKPIETPRPVLEPTPWMKHRKAVRDNLAPKILQLRKEGLAAAKICARLDISDSTYRRVLKEAQP